MAKKFGGGKKWRQKKKFRGRKKRNQEVKKKKQNLEATKTMPKNIRFQSIFIKSEAH